MKFSVNAALAWSAEDDSFARLAKSFLRVPCATKYKHKVAVRVQ